MTQLPRELPFACALQHLHRTHFELEHHIDRLMETSSSSGSQTSGPEVQLQHQQQKGDLFQSLLHRRPKIIFRNGIHYRYPFETLNSLSNLTANSAALLPLLQADLRRFGETMRSSHSSRRKCADFTWSRRHLL